MNAHRSQPQPQPGRHAATALGGVVVPLVSASALAFVAVVGLAGCASSLFGKPVQPPGLLTLDDGARATATATPAPAAAPSAPTLIVNTTRAAAGFDTVHMVYVPRASEIAYFAFNQWVDTPARMLAPALARALERTGAFRAVLMAPTAVNGRLRLETEIVRLQQDFTTTPSQVRFTLRAALIDAQSRRAVAQREFDASVQSASEDAYGGAAAAQKATQQVLSQLAAFCAEAAGR